VPSCITLVLYIYRTHCLQFRYKLPFAKIIHKSIISNKYHHSHMTTVTQDPTIIDGQDRADLSTFLASYRTSPSIDKYVHIGKLRIRPTDVAASNITSCNGCCFSVYIFTALAPFPPPPTPQTVPNGIHSHLSREKPSPFRNAAVAALLDRRSGERRGVTSQLVQRCHSLNHCEHISFISVIFCLAPVHL
jgi:hypothetical protein